MSTSKFTPGPWNAVNATPTDALDIAIIFDESSQVVCSVPKGSSHTPMMERRANARLIAAAPEMYAALELAHQWLQLNPEIGVDEVAPRIDAALAKARGES